MLDTRDYAIIGASDNVQTILTQNTELKKDNNVLVATLILISVTVGLFVYWHNVEDKKKIKSIET